MPLVSLLWGAQIIQRGTNLWFHRLDTPGVELFIDSHLSVIPIILIYGHLLALAYSFHQDPDLNPLEEILENSLETNNLWGHVAFSCKLSPPVDNPDNPQLHIRNPLDV